jgi:hypothetical protein
MFAPAGDFASGYSGTSVVFIFFPKISSVSPDYFKHRTVLYTLTVKDLDLEENRITAREVEITR